MSRLTEQNQKSRHRRSVYGKSHHHGAVRNQGISGVGKFDFPYRKNTIKILSHTLYYTDYVSLQVIGMKWCRVFLTCISLMSNKD